MASSRKNCALVIVAVDGSKHCDCALDYYLKNLHRPGYTVGLLHCYETPDFVVHAANNIVKLNVDDVEKKFRSAWDAVDKLMDKYKKICEEHGVENIREFVEHKKKPGEAICAVAETENPAFIVLANRGQSLLRRTFVGSVSEFVVHHSKKTPVLLVP